VQLAAAEAAEASVQGRIGQQMALFEGAQAEKEGLRRRMDDLQVGGGGVAVVCGAEWGGGCMLTLSLLMMSSDARLYVPTLDQPAQPTNPNK